MGVDGIAHTYALYIQNIQYLIFPNMINVQDGNRKSSAARGRLSKHTMSDQRGLDRWFPVKKSNDLSRWLGMTFEAQKKTETAQLNLVPHIHCQNQFHHVIQDLLWMTVLEMTKNRRALSTSDILICTTAIEHFAQFCSVSNLHASQKQAAFCITFS